MNKKWWPHQVTIETKERVNKFDTSEWVARKNWLRDHYKTMLGDYHINGDTYCFTEEQDMVHFLLVNQ